MQITTDRERFTQNWCKKLTGVKNGEGLSLRENYSKILCIVVTLIKGNLATTFP